MIRCENGKVRMEGAVLDVVADVCGAIEAVVAVLVKEDDNTLLPLIEAIDFAIKRGIEKSKKGESNE